MSQGDWAWRLRSASQSTPQIGSQPVTTVAPIDGMALPITASNDSNVQTLLPPKPVENK